MKTQKCIACGWETVSVIKTEEGYICYNCYSDKKNPPKQKQHHDNEEARIQSEFFSKVPLFFPNLPDRLLFAVPNGGSRHKIEAANMKCQGVILLAISLSASATAFSCRYRKRDMLLFV